MKSELLAGVLGADAGRVVEEVVDGSEGGRALAVRDEPVGSDSGLVVESSVALAADSVGENSEQEDAARDDTVGADEKEVEEGVHERKARSDVEGGKKRVGEEGDDGKNSEDDGDDLDDVGELGAGVVGLADVAVETADGVANVGDERFVDGIAIGGTVFVRDECLQLGLLFFGPADDAVDFGEDGVVS